MGWKFRSHSPESWERAVRKYFRETPEDEWTLPGLSIACGITTRTFQRYANEAGYQDACQLAKDLINQKRERMLEAGSGYGNGIVFLLKVNGYQDTQQIEVKQDLNVTGDLTVEQLLEIGEEEIQA